MPAERWRHRGTRAGQSGVLAAVAVCCAALLLPAGAMAQDPTVPEAPPGKPPVRVEAGIGLLVGVPVGGFASNVGSAVGLSGYLGGPLSDVVTLAGDVSYLWYGRQQRDLPLRPDIPEIAAHVVTYNNILTAHARLRVQSRPGPYRLYVDGLFGVRDIYTRSVLDLSEDLGADYVARDVNLRDVGVSYGVGGGIMVGLGSGRSRAMLDVSVRLMSSPEADYLVPGALRTEGRDLVLDISRARPSLVLLSIGVSVPVK